MVFCLTGQYHAWGPMGVEWVVVALGLGARAGGMVGMELGHGDDGEHTRGMDTQYLVAYIVRIWWSSRSGRNIDSTLDMACCESIRPLR